MSILALSNFISLSLTALFASAAMIHLLAPSALRTFYQEWGYKNGFCRAAALLLFTTAFFLALPETRLWGALLGGAVTFAAVVALLYRGRFLFALPGYLVLFVLPLTMVPSLLP